MPAPLRLKGVAASGGYAEGPIFRLDREAAVYTASGSTEAEERALRAAVDRACLRIEALMGAANEESAAILEFQLAMLSDDALTGPAYAAVAEGKAADDAWKEAIDAEIVGYEVAADEYFRARAADLKDIRAQVLAQLTDDGEEKSPPGAILFGEDIAPTRFLETDWSRGGGVALTGGSSASHVAMLARARGVPMVVGLGRAIFEPTGLALLDAEHGGIVLAPGPADLAGFRSASSAWNARQAGVRDYLARPAATRDGTPVKVQVNVADPSDVTSIDIAHCDGVGLMRTEFLFGKVLPDEQTQYRAYRTVLEWAKGKPVTIRTVDAGGDKPVPGFTVEEGNPFLGLRGVRLSLSRPEIFRVQIRALLRAAPHGNLKVMFPMIAIADEYRRARAMFAEEALMLQAGGVAHRMPPLGIMVEVPSVAVAPEELAEAAFFSIGSNDLTQYVMAAARDNGTVASLNSVLNPAVLRLIGQVAAFGRARNIPVSLCGDAGGDPVAIAALLKAGLRDLSVVPAQLAAAKAAIAAASV